VPLFVRGEMDITSLITAAKGIALVVRQRQASPQALGQVRVR
jgi:hypothetical protein